MRMQVFQLLGIFSDVGMATALNFSPKPIYFIRLSNLMF